MSKRFVICVLTYLHLSLVVLSENSESVAHNNNNNNTIVCGNAGQVLHDCFNNLSPELLKFLSISKIPVTKKEINGKCTVFRQGMMCVEAYTSKCIENDKRKVFESTVFGAKSFLNKLCDDKKFQTDYLRHKDCFVYIEDDWQRCSTQFLTILTDELHSVDHSSKNSSTKFMQFCCSRFAYEQCICNSAKIKCHKTSANFVENVVQILSRERHFHNCKRYEDLLCSGSYMKTVNASVILVIVIYSIFTIFVKE